MKRNSLLSERLGIKTEVFFLCNHEVQEPQCFHDTLLPRCIKSVQLVIMGNMTVLSL